MVKENNFLRLFPGLLKDRSHGHVSISAWGLSRTSYLQHWHCRSILQRLTDELSCFVLNQSFHPCCGWIYSSGLPTRDLSVCGLTGVLCFSWHESLQDFFSLVQGHWTSKNSFTVIINRLCVLILCFILGHGNILPVPFTERKHLYHSTWWLAALEAINCAQMGRPRLPGPQHTYTSLPLCLSPAFRPCPPDLAARLSHPLPLFKHSMGLTCSFSPLGTLLLGSFETGERTRKLPWLDQYWLSHVLPVSCVV